MVWKQRSSAFGLLHRDEQRFSHYCRLHLVREREREREEKPFPVSLVLTSNRCADVRLFFDNHFCFSTVHLSFFLASCFVLFVFVLFCLCSRTFSWIRTVPATGRYSWTFLTFDDYNDALYGIAGMNFLVLGFYATPKK